MIAERLFGESDKENNNEEGEIVRISWRIRSIAETRATVRITGL